MTGKRMSLPGAIFAMIEPQTPYLAIGEDSLQGQSRWHERRQAIGRLHQRELRSLFHSQAVYILLSLSLLATLLFLQTYLNFVQEQGLLVTSGALNGLLYTVIFLASLFLALSVITTTGRERTVGMTTDLRGETADAFSYVLGKHLAQVTTYLILGISYGGCLIILAGLVNFSLSPDLIWIGLVSVPITSQVVALGIFLASLFSQGQVARNLFLSIVLALIVIQFGPEVLTNITPQAVYDPLILSGQHSLASLRGAISWISPYAHLSRGIEAVMLGHQATYLTTLLSAALQTGLYLSLSIVMLQRQEGLK